MQSVMTNTGTGEEAEVVQITPSLPDVAPSSGATLNSEKISPARCGGAGNGGAWPEFEQFISTLSGRLNNLPSDRVDPEITSALHQVLDYLQFDRCYLLSIPHEQSEEVVTHCCCRDGVVATPPNSDMGQSFPWAKEKLLRGELVSFSSLEEVPVEAVVDRQSWQALGVKSNVAIPIHVSGSLQFVFFVQDICAARERGPQLVARLRLLGEICANALTRSRLESDYRQSCAEVLRLKEKVQLETENFHTQIMCFPHNEQVIGQSEALARTLVLAEQVAPTDCTVLITGETGTGKELVARTIHELSPRRNMPLVKVNCASLPAALVESELFGREKGAYTGALTRQAGRFEVADGATIFLDEIAEMSVELQAKLLRVLQEGQFERLGSTKTIKVNVRVIAATNRNLAEEVKKGSFREDLYYRLNVFQIVVPQLRERTEDIPLLTWAFVHEFSEKMGKKITKISKQDMTALQGYPWPGNVRELRNVIEYSVIVSNGDRLQVRLPEDAREKLPRTLTLEEYEAIHIRDALQLTNWRIKGEGGAANLLGLNPSTLYSRMKKLGISSQRVKEEM